MMNIRGAPDLGQPTEDPSSGGGERERIRQRMKMVIGQLEGILRELKEVAKELREVSEGLGQRALAPAFWSHPHVVIIACLPGDRVSMRSLPLCDPLPKSAPPETCDRDLVPGLCRLQAVCGGPQRLISTQCYQEACSPGTCASFHPKFHLLISDLVTQGPRRGGVSPWKQSPLLRTLLRDYTATQNPQFLEKLKPPLTLPPAMGIGLCLANKDQHPCVQGLGLDSPHHHLSEHIVLY